MSVKNDRACDVVVVGGSVAGCLCALGAAKAGARVVLLEPGTYLGREFTSWLRPWIGRKGQDSLPDDLASILLPYNANEADVDLSSLPAWCREEMPLLRGGVKKRLLALLTDAGVEVWFMCRAAGVALGAGTVQGIILADKHGLQLLTSSMVIDATSRADLCRGGETPASVWHSVVGYSGVRLPEECRLAVPPELGLAGDHVTLHAGASTLSPMYLEFAFRAGSQAEANAEARRLAIRLTRHLVGQVPAFASACLCDIAAESFCEVAPAVVDADLPNGLIRFPGELKNTATCSDLGRLAESCRAFGRAAALEVRARAVPAEIDGIRSGASEIPFSAFRVQTFDDPGLGVALQGLEVIDPARISVRAECDVLVAGGGTAGANTAIAAADHGADTIVLEANPDLGGTQTLGMVCAYYHGYKGGYTRIQEDRFRLFCESFQSNGRSVRWLAKLLFYFQAVEESGARCILNSAVCGGVVDGSRVTGLLGADSGGLFRVTARVTVDATGDGDAAAFCGALTTFGNPRDGNVQDYSQWSRGHGAWGTVPTHLDLDVIDQRLLSETLRGLRIAHLKGYDFDFSPMLTVREGRHVLGDYTLSLVDILEGRTFSDGIAEAQTDWDPHGISSSWLGRLGFLPVHCDPFYIQIPYRCCLPRGLSGLLISAKAISATTDAACLCRMAADIQNLGWATGIAAALAASLGGDTRGIDVEALRGELCRIGVLRDDSPSRARVSGTVKERIGRLAGGDEGALLDVAILPREQAIPALQSAFDCPENDRLNLAKGLAWFGDPAGAELLKTRLADLSFAEPERYDDSHPHKEGNPRAGIVDTVDDYWRINQLLVLLGLAQNTASVPTVVDLIERTWSGGAPIRAANAYVAGRIDMQRIPHFDRLLCIAFCAERLADPGLVEALDRLLDREDIGGHVCRNDEGSAGPVYHGALAEVLLAAAAARCGSRKGAGRLIEFLEDLHSILRRFAQDELTKITNGNFGFDCAAWRTWLETGWSAKPVPVGVTSPVF